MTPIYEFTAYLGVEADSEEHAQEIANDVADRFVPSYPDTHVRLAVDGHAQEVSG